MRLEFADGLTQHEAMSPSHTLEVEILNYEQALVLPTKEATLCQQLHW
jgi:hypothetical protein